MTDARWYLNQARIMSAKAKAKQEEIEKIESLLLQGVSFEEKLGSGNNLNKNEHIIFRLIELKDQLNWQLEELIEKQVEIMGMIDRLSSAEEISILHKRYLQSKKFVVIADEMNYSERQVYRVHDQAVADIQKLLNDVIECQ